MMPMPCICSIDTAISIPFDCPVQLRGRKLLHPEGKDAGPVLLTLEFFSCRADIVKPLNASHLLCFNHLDETSQSVQAW
jgi:hypothetical protein